MKSQLLILMFMLVCLVFIAPTARGQMDSSAGNWAALQTVARAMVDSGDHAGNVFLLGENALVPLPDGIQDVRTWRVADEMDEEVVSGKYAGVKGDRLDLGALPVGWYRIGLSDASGEELGWTTAAVLAPLMVSTLR